MQVICKCGSSHYCTTLDVESSWCGFILPRRLSILHMFHIHCAVGVRVCLCSELAHSQAERDAMKQQAESTNREYDRLLKEHASLQVWFFTSMPFTISDAQSLFWLVLFLYVTVCLWAFCRSINHNDHVIHFQITGMDVEYVWVEGASIGLTTYLSCLQWQS